MRPNSQKKRTNQKGAVIVTAVAVLIIMSILMTATISYVSVNRKKTNDNYCHKQAYLTASTTLKGIVKQIELATGAPKPDGANGSAKTVEEQKANINAIKALAAANGGQGTPCYVTYNGDVETDYKIGTTQIVLSQEDGNEDNLVVTAYTTYAGVTEKVAAHFSLTALKKPARFTNTIEQIGTQSMTLNNLFVVGDTAVLDNDNLKKKYTMNNDINLQGSLYIWGSVTPTNMTSCFRLGPNVLDGSKGTFVQISEDVHDKLVSRATVKRGDGYNYVYVGGSCFTPSVRLGVPAGHKQDLPEIDPTQEGCQVDLITHGVEATGGGSNWVQYGNVYCYNVNEDDDTILTRNGDFKISGGEKVYIKGDVFIEGNLEVVGSDCVLKIDGELHVAGKITGSYTATGGTFQGANAKIEKSGRGKEPEMEYTSRDYKYMPEDFFMNRDGKSSANFKQAYEALSKGTNSKEMFKDFGPYTTDDSYKVTCNFHVTENCSITAYTNTADNGGVKNSKNVPMDSARVVLVDVTDDSGDIMIMLKNGVTLKQDVEIVVRNRSTKKSTTLADGTVEMQHQYNCYFVSDSGTSITADGETKNGVKKHKGSTPGFFSFECLNLYDYDTYVRMFNPSYYQAKNGAGYATRDSIQNVQPKDNFVYNPTHDDSLTVDSDDWKKTGVSGTPEVYCPGSSSIIILVGEEFTFGPKYDPDVMDFTGPGSANQSFIQATFYGPQGYFGIKTQHLKLKVMNSKGRLYDVGNEKALGVGVFVAKVFNSKERSYFYYTEPAGSCVLANAKGSQEADATGFELDRYDHY